MSGPTMFGTPRRERRGLTLTLVFGAVLATGAATGSFGGGPGPATPGRTPAAAPAAGTSSAGGLRGAAAIAWAIDEGRLGPRTAARYVLRHGGPWSAYYTPQQFEGFRRELTGGYVGVGLWVRRAADGTVGVTRVQPGSPARRAGVTPGDTVTAIGGVPVTGRPVTDVVAMLRGTGPATAPAPDPGSAVRVALTHHGRPRTVTLRRAWLSDHPVTVSHPAPGVTRIAVSAFTQGVAGQVRAALAAGGHRAGVLLDLRGDSGGLVTEAVGVASQFLPGGLVATYDVDGTPRTLDAAPGGDTATPLVVLVDGGTMSAAELLTGALQDRGRAVVVGSRTFGKGTVQLPTTLPGGAVAELTVGRYRTPGGHRVDGRGIRPDVLVPPAGPPATAQKTAVTVLSGLGGGS